MKRKAIVYSADGCDICGVVKAHLKSLLIDVDERNIDDAPQEMKDFIASNQGGALPGIQYCVPHIAPDIFSCSYVTAKEVLTW